MAISEQEYRQTFGQWLRTGMWQAEADDGPVEVKFNPYHDPRNGQFTFAPGGPRVANRAVARSRTNSSIAPSSGDRERYPFDERLPEPQETALLRYRPPATLRLASFPRNPRASRGGNSGAFHDPMILEQVFPGLRNQPGGSMLALADNVFDLTGPAQALTRDLTEATSNRLIRQIQAIDPDYRFESFGPPTTAEGQAKQIRHLLGQRAASFVRKKGELRPMQVETLRVMQDSADNAYAEGIRRLKAGRLPFRLSEQEALGNFVDRTVRADLRKFYSGYGIDSAGQGPVRVNRREASSSQGDTSYRRPDARVGELAYDVTLSRKTLKTPQVRGFFDADFRPRRVIIVRPRQIGQGASYIINRPE